MAPFEPIAIVGRGCVLPGALDPDALLKLVMAGEVKIAPAPKDRLRTDISRLLRPRANGPDDEYIVSDRGGYVSGFERVFEPKLFAGIPALERFDPLVHWLLYCGRAALAEAGVNAPPPRSALIAGNLSYPTSGHTAFVEAFWRAREDSPPTEELPDARNRFSSGLPIHLAADALGLNGRSFAIDAACASSLYAIKLACDRLHAGEGDLMLAGGVNRADALFIHLGFTALQALSPSGRSRPFHRAADGLLPAEGAALVALKRLDDAVRDGNKILGVIRGIGLSNDGRQNGFLAPAQDGQVRAITSAYEQSGLMPEDVSFVECHATGTAKGDGIEIGALTEAWGRAKKPVLGSLKANIGHSITASGAASLIKMLGALAAGLLPPTPSCDQPIEALGAHGFRLLTGPAAWEGPRRAAISNFGFGGNNAHMIVEAWDKCAPRQISAGAPKASHAKLAVVGMGVVAGDARGIPAFAARLAGKRIVSPRTNEIALPMERLGFPPRDLEASLPQQTALLAAADEAIRQAGEIDPERASVFVGMGCDTTVARHGLRLRLEGATDEMAWRAANTTGAPRLTAAGAIGAMPNIPANRINAQRDWRGPSFTVSSEELSGLDALEITARALNAGEIDTALVGAADFCCEPTHEAAAAALGPAPVAGDAAVALVLMRLEDAQATSRRILSIIDPIVGDVSERTTTPARGVEHETGDEVIARFGHAHAASGLLRLTGEIVAAVACARLDGAGAWPAPSRDAARAVTVTSFDGRSTSAVVIPPPPPAERQQAIAALVKPPVCRFYAAASRADLFHQLTDDHEELAGNMRLALVAESDEALAARRKQASEALKRGQTPGGNGIYYGEGTNEGDVAFCFTGAAAAYPGAGRELLLAFPEIGRALAERFEGTPALARKLFGANVTAFTPETQLTGSAFLCQAHADLTLRMLSMRPAAAIGLSSGETNALLAFGVWRDLDRMLEEIDISGLYGHELTGECRAASAHWGEPGSPADWRCWRISAPVAEVEAALAAEARAYMTIIQHDEDSVIGGDAASCARIIERIGRGRCIPLGLDMVVHCAPFAPFAEEWRRIHTRDTYPAPGVRFYTNATGKSYVPTREAAAAASTQQAGEPIDFRRTIERAHADGVRVFIEHGPRGILTSAIDRILGSRPHLALALDRQRNQGLPSVASTIAQLWAAGVPMNLAPFAERLRALRPPREEARGSQLVLRAHPPDIVWPEPKATPRVSLPVIAAAPPVEPHGVAETMAPASAAPTYDLRALFATAASLPQRMHAAANDDVANPALALFRSIAGAHASYLARQKEVHDSFLHLRASGYATSRTPNRGSQVAVVPPRPFAAKVPLAPQVQTARQPTKQIAPLALTRAELEVHSAGKISEIFGPLFEQQDGYSRQVRMPEPPLLLADRALRFEGERGGMGTGRVTTETDVRDGWYIHVGRMSPGVVIESGQADLLLISYLGADFLNKGERVYRLLGCDLTFHGDLPEPGDTLTYDIRVTGHAKTGDVRLFFFNYECRIGERPLISVTNGQAGFFTDEELAASGGVLWDAAEDTPNADARLDPPPQSSRKRQFTEEEVDAFIAGDAWACFGEGFERAAPHTRTPTIPGGRLRPFARVAAFDPQGGPWQRGYLRAEIDVPPDAWFYQGHFKNDPCMPGTLMADAAVQALAFTMAAMGFTLARDGWRFEPAPSETARFQCRGQVVPDGPHKLEYEVFVEEIIDGPMPLVFAALLCKSDGFKVFHCRRFGLRLVPDWPLTTNRQALIGSESPRAAYPDTDVGGDYGALLACAWGRPSDAFGQMFAEFDGTRRGPRLPGPPYHFMTRILSVDAPPGAATAGATVMCEYDVPRDAWYFADGAGAMPFAVLLEVMLQPCGWLSSYMNFVAATREDIAFRNLDGDECRLHKIVMPEAGTLRVTSTLARFAQAGGTTIVFFRVTCAEAATGEAVMDFNTSFGFFSPQALAAQVGLPTTDDQRAALIERSPVPVIDLASEDLGLKRVPGLGSARLKMLDEITGFWPKGGPAGLGRIRARQQIRPDAWYFKAHFFQDPVQPGSLGLEALIELGEALMVLQGHTDDFDEPIFEPIAREMPLIWRYRGQVVPTNKEVVTELEALSVERGLGMVTMTLRGSLWVDGLRIYETAALSVRAREAS